MAVEIEVKFLNVDVEAVRASLTEHGAHLEIPMRLMRRSQFDYPDGRIAKSPEAERLRVRDEGTVVTVTHKKAQTGSPYPVELETTVGSYEDMCQIFEALGFKAFSRQESKRETWQFGEVEVVIDEWPWLNSYIEIEGPSEEHIKQAANDLGFDWSQARYGSVDTAYKDQYKKMVDGESIGQVPDVRFDAPLPDFLKERQ